MSEWWGSGNRGLLRGMQGKGQGYQGTPVCGAGWRGRGARALVWAARVGT